MSMVLDGMGSDGYYGVYYIYYYTIVGIVPCIPCHHWKKGARCSRDRFRPDGQPLTTVETDFDFVRGQCGSFIRRLSSCMGGGWRAIWTHEAMRAWSFMWLVEGRSEAKRSDKARGTKGGWGLVG